MDETLSQAAEAFRREMGSKRGRRFTDDQRVRGQRLALELRGMGLSWSQLELRLGVSDSAIRRWVHPESRKGGGSWLPVVVTAPTRPERVETGLILHSGQGWWLEGLNLDQVADLLARRA